MPPRVQKEFLTVVRDESHLEALLGADSNKLSVVDVFQSWCGPCSLVLPTLRSTCMKIDEWDKRIQILQADVDHVPSLREHQHSSKPKFLFFVGHKLVTTIDGLNAPVLLASITRYLPSLDQD